MFIVTNNKGFILGIFYSLYLAEIFKNEIQKHCDTRVKIKELNKNTGKYM